MLETLAGDEEEAEAASDVEFPVGVDVADDAAVASPSETLVVLDVVPLDRRPDLPLDVVSNDQKSGLASPTVYTDHASLPPPRLSAFLKRYFCRLTHRHPAHTPDTAWYTDRHRPDRPLRDRRLHNSNRSP